MAPAPLHRISIFDSATHNQTGPLWCWFPSGWAYAHSRPLWVSLTTSPVRLGVCPAAAPTPTGAFNQRFEALFPRAGALGYVVCFAPHRSSRFICVRVWGHGVLPAALPAPFSTTLSLALQVYLCMNVGLWGATHRSACPVLRHSESGPLSLSVCECGVEGSASAWTACAVCPTLRQSRSHHSHLSPLHPVPVSAPPTGLDECLFFISLVSDPLAIRFSVSSDCARRRSVSTYAAILVLPAKFLLRNQLTVYENSLIGS